MLTRRVIAASVILSHLTTPTCPTLLTTGFTLRPVRRCAYTGSQPVPSCRRHLNQACGGWDPVTGKMPKAPKPAFYAVAKGRQTGIFSSWPECESQVKGFVGAVHKKFPSRSQAQDFLDAAGKGRNAGESYQAAAKAAAAATAPKSRPAASKTDMSRQSSGRVAKRRDSETSASSHHSVDDVTSDALRSLQAKGFAVDRNRLVVWTDGASKDNGKRIARAGVGVFWGKRGDAGRM